MATKKNPNLGVQFGAVTPHETVGLAKSQFSDHPEDASGDRINDVEWVTRRGALTGGSSSPETLPTLGFRKFGPGDEIKSSVVEYGKPGVKFGYGSSLN